MCCDELSDNSINHLHERALRTVYSDNVSTFEKSLEKDNSVTIHVRNLRIVATALYKTKKSGCFDNLLSQTDFQLVLVNTVNCVSRALFVSKYKKLLR